MKKEEWNEGLNHMDPDLVEKYVEQKEKCAQKKRDKSVWLRFGAMAACLVLIASTVIVMPMLWEDDPVVIPNPDTTDNNDILIIPNPDTTDNNDIPTIPIVNIQTPSSAPQYYGSEVNPSSAGAAADIATDGISVTARLVYILPDTYTFYDDWWQRPYRIIQFEVVRLLKGQNMPDSFYFLIPEEYMTDYSEYDCFVIRDMGMFGYDHSVLYNQTDECAEQLDMVLFGGNCCNENRLDEDFMAFNEDGYLDIRLWKSTEAWEKSTAWILTHTNLYNDEYSLAQAENTAGEEYSDRQVVLLDSLTGDAASTLEFVKDFQNGLFIPDSDGFKLFNGSYVSLSLRRYIGGFATNERVRIYNSDSAHWSKARFSKEDEQNLPDLTSAIASIAGSFEAGEVTPPHILNYKEMTNTVHGIFGWYAKTAEGVIGIIRVDWCYRDDQYNTYYDDLYYIIEYGSHECTPIERDALLERLGEYETTYIYMGEYDELGKVSDRYAPMP